MLFQLQKAYRLSDGGGFEGYHKLLGVEVDMLQNLRAALEGPYQEWRLAFIAVDFGGLPAYKGPEKELADYEKMLDEVVATEELLREWIFEKQKAEVLIAWEGDHAVGFALFFHNFSTFLGRAGLYLEDLFVLPEYRGKGYGKALLRKLAQITVERDCGRLEWCCLDWNQPSIDFYRSLGAEALDEWTVYSVGGGALAEEGISTNVSPDIYEMTKMTDILAWCERTGRSYWEYVAQCEDPDIWDYLAEVWKTMCNAVENGLEHEGVLPGPLNLRRKAATYYIKAKGYKDNLRSRGLVFAYALAVSEENASGGKIVTAPTCGSCGVVPAVLYHLYKSRDFSQMRMLRALATAGLIGNIVKHNATISGAEGGCQAEVGVACSMASAAASQLFGGSPAQIEYAAEMGLEHHLGLTCDPVGGLVQIPCIERNAYAAARAFDAGIYALYTDGLHRVTFDQEVHVMKETGKDLPSLYKETSEGGLAKHLE